MILLLFDVDGTLIRSHGVGRRAMARAITEITGIPDPMNGIALGGRTDPLILEEVMRRAGRQLDGRATAIWERYIEHLADGLQRARKFAVLPGVLTLLDHLSQFSELALAVGTGNIEPGARLKLGRAGLNDYFATGGFGSDGRARDEVLRAGVRKAQAHFGADFEAIWVIGDTERDVLAARQIGARVLAVATGHSTIDQLQALKPDVAVTDLEDWRRIGALWVEQ